MEVLEKAYIVSDYDENRGTYSHTGVDVLSACGNRKVRAVAKGKVVKFRNDMEDGFIVNDKSPVDLWAGNYVILEHGNGYTSRYSHLKLNSFNINIGDIIEGEFAEEGESGFATGVHLDFEIKLNGKFINPTNYALGKYNLPEYVVPTPVEPDKQYINLSPEADTWRVYPMNVAPVVGNECKQLLPKQFGGLSYTIFGYTQPNVAIIKTRDYGQVQIFIGHPLAEVTNSPKFGLVR